MANEEHLKILKQGVEAWNKWREENPNIGPDLRGADLSHTTRRADFREVNFHRTDLREAKLRWANLEGAYLGRANFHGANLRRANLNSARAIQARFGSADLRGARISRANLRRAYFSGANLRGASLVDADLRRADLRRADLTGANLRGANLSRVNLNGTILTRAVIGWTIFAEVNLSLVEDLETVEHDGPSSIGVDTIYASGGKIPELFLRNAGVPESFIGQFFPFHFVREAASRKYIEKAKIFFIAF